MKKTFFDVVDAVKACQGIPEDDMARVVRSVLPPVLLPSMAEMYAKLDALDRAQLSICMSFAFHCGYAMSLDDVSNGKNQHVEYVNEQRANGSPAVAGNASPNHG